jgi:hypothetical protein
MAVSASSAKFVSQCLFLVCRMYLVPLFSRSNSGLEKVLSVLLTTLGKNQHSLGRSEQLRARICRRNSTGKVTERLATLCNVSDVYTLPFGNR